MTTDQGWNVVNTNSNDAQELPGQNRKSVECRLKSTYSKLARTEANIYMFMKLKSMNLATNDVSSFVAKQTTHKKALTAPDMKLRRVAMKSKIVDALTYAKRLRHERDVLKRRVARKFCTRKAQGRKTCADLVALYHVEKEKEFSEAKLKIDHLKRKEFKENEIKLAPEDTREFLSHVNAFSKDQLKMERIDPETPFICSKDIELNENERKLLARGPNFMMCEELDAEMFEIEVEKAIVKHKYNVKFNSKDDCFDKDLSCERNERGIRERTVRNAGNKNLSLEKSETDIEGKFNELWAESSGGMIYNLKEKTLDLGNLKATNYKYNKSVGLPDADTPELETLHEFRRTECKRIFNKAVKQTSGQMSK